MVEFIRALPVDFDHCRNLSACQEAAARSVREAAPPVVQRWPVLPRLLAATSSGQVVDCLTELVARSKCPMAYLSPDENTRLSLVGLSPDEQLLLGRLRERFEERDAGS